MSACSALVLALGLALASCTQTGSEPPASESSAALKPSQVLKDFETNDIRDGIQSMTLVSPEARLYDSRKLADVDKPIVTFYKAGKPSSNLTAPFGQLQTESHEVDVWGGVTVVTADSSTLITERLHYDPVKRKITSKDSVRLEKTDSITEGVGLETDPELERVKIGKQKVRFKKGMKQ